ncbi:MAG: hypothetical protein DKINENOH_03886 [bacterium]|nr:hypothetical protein [bacterium]
MAKEFSPFTPGVPVPLEFFVGRAEEIQRIINSARKAVALKTLERLFVLGERGIGKSSICKFALSVIERDVKLLGLHVFLGGVHTLEEMVRRIFERLLRESIDKPWYEKTKEFLGNHIRQLDIFGLTVEFSASDRELSRAVSDFVPALKNLLTKLVSEKQGILLILDDLNGLAGSEQFANWLKSFVDEMATEPNPVPVVLVLVGLPERRQQLIAKQPSLDRVFDLIEIRGFSASETAEFYQRAFKKANVAITEEALRILERLSGGFPVFVHELGDAVFQVDEDNRIDDADIIPGILRGADLIGRKYIEPTVLAAIRSEKYRDILRKIAQRPFEHRFSRKEVAARLSAAEARVFDNFLRRMETLGALRKDKERGPGSYEFASELYYFFFWLQTQSPPPKSGVAASAAPAKRT